MRRAVAAAFALLLLAVALSLPSQVLASTDAQGVDTSAAAEEGGAGKTDALALRDVIICFQRPDDSQVDELAARILANGLAGDQDFLEHMREGGLEAHARHAQEGTRAERVVAQAQAAAHIAQSPARALIDDYRERTGTELECRGYWAGNSLRVKAPAELVDQLCALDGVCGVSENVDLQQSPIQPAPEMFDRSAVADVREVEANLKAIRADRVWSELGIDGSGVTVGIVDQSVDLAHPALREHFKGYDPQTGESSQEGCYLDLTGGKQGTHGSHVAGIIVGSERRSSEAADVDYNRIGVAPGANFIAAAAFIDGVGGSNERVIAACQWMMAPGGNPANAPRIVNHSWSDGTSKIDPWFDETMRSMRAMGILNVMSSGNNGSKLAPAGSIDNPAGSDLIFSVGACDNDGVLAPFSRRGPVPGAGGRIKPDLVAPGVQVRSALPGGGYAAWDGTSMSAPHVSGVAALVWQANPELSLEELEQILRESARSRTDASYPDAPNMGYGHGMVDAYAAVSAALKAVGKDPSAHTGSLSGSVSVQATNEEEPFGELSTALPVTAYAERPLVLSVELSNPSALSKLELRVKGPAGEKSYEYKRRSSASRRFDLTIPEEDMQVGTMEARLAVTDLAGRVYFTDVRSVSVAESVGATLFSTDFEGSTAGFSFTGDFSASVANLQFDPKPTSGSRCLGLDMGSFHMGEADQSLAVLPRLDLTSEEVLSKSKVELVFMEHANWSKGVLGIQMNESPVSGSAIKLMNYDIKVEGEWQERRIDLTPYKGKKLDIFFFSLTRLPNHEPFGADGRGLYVDDLRVELDGARPAASSLTGEQGFGRLSLEDANPSKPSLSPIAARLHLLDSEGNVIASAESSAADGSYSFDDVRRGDHTLLVGADGCHSQKIPVTISEQQATADIVLQRLAAGEDPMVDDAEASRPHADPADGLKGFGFDNNNPLGGAILHGRVGRGTAIEVEAPSDGVLDHVMVYFAGDNPILRDGPVEISVKQVNSMGRLIDLIEPTVVEAQCGAWNRFDFSERKLAMSGRLYVVVRQILPTGETPAVALDSSVRGSTEAFSHGYVFTGEFLGMRSSGYYGMPMIRAYFSTAEDVHDADPVEPEFDESISWEHVADPIEGEGQAPKDIVTIGDWQISPSNGMIVGFDENRLKELYEKNPPDERVLVIPSEVGGIKISSIGGGVFKKPGSGVGDIARVEIPEGVTEINGEAFDRMGMRELILPQSLERIYDHAFRNAKVKELRLPARLSYIGHGAFQYARDLSALDIPDSVQEIGASAFSGCKGVTTLRLPNNPSFKEIHASSFRSLRKLEKLEIPASVTNIRLGAFADCRKLASVSFPEGLKSIDESAFDASPLAAIELPDSVEEIGADAFSGAKLTSLRLPSSLKKVGGRAFQNNKIETLVLPEGLTSVGPYAFGMNPLRLIRLNAGIELAERTGAEGLDQSAFEGSVERLELFRAEQANDHMRATLKKADGSPSDIVVLGAEQSRTLELASEDGNLRLSLSAASIPAGAQLLVRPIELTTGEHASIQEACGKGAAVKAAYSVRLADANGHELSFQGSAHLLLDAREVLVKRLNAQGLGPGEVGLVSRPLGTGAWSLLGVRPVDGSFGLEISRMGDFVVVSMPESDSSVPSGVDYGVVAGGSIRPVEEEPPVVPGPGNPGTSDAPNNPGTPGGSSSSRPTVNTALVRTADPTPALVTAMSCLVGLFLLGTGLLFRRFQRDRLD